MPSNEELTISIAEAAEAAGVDVPSVEGKNNAEMAEILKGLRALPPAADASAPAAEPEKLPPYTVAEGKAITSSKGILSDGAEVTAEMLPGGAKTLKALVESKHVDAN